MMDEEGGVGMGREEEGEGRWGVGMKIGRGEGRWGVGKRGVIRGRRRRTGKGGKGGGEEVEEVEGVWFFEASAFVEDGMGSRMAMMMMMRYVADYLGLGWEDGRTLGHALGLVLILILALGSWSCFAGMYIYYIVYLYLYFYLLL